MPSDTPQVVCLHQHELPRPLQAADQHKHDQPPPKVPTSSGSPVKALPWNKVPTASTSTDHDHGRRARRTIKVIEVPTLPGWPDFTEIAQIAPTAPHHHTSRQEREEDHHRGRLPHHLRHPHRRTARCPRSVGPKPLAHREHPALGTRRHLRRGPLPSPHRTRRTRHGHPAQHRDRALTPHRPQQHRRCPTPPRPRPRPEPSHAPSLAETRPSRGPGLAMSLLRLQGWAATAQDVRHHAANNKPPTDTPHHTTNDFAGILYLTRISLARGADGPGLSMMKCWIFYTRCPRVDRTPIAALRTMLGNAAARRPIQTARISTTSVTISTKPVAAIADATVKPARHPGNAAAINPKTRPATTNMAIIVKPPTSTVHGSRDAGEPDHANLQTVAPRANVAGVGR